MIRLILEFSSFTLYVAYSMYRQRKPTVETVRSLRALLEVIVLNAAFCVVTRTRKKNLFISPIPGNRTHSRRGYSHTTPLRRDD